MDCRLEVVGVPVSDIDRAKAFYVQVGFVADHDQRVDETLRFVQLTPVGSGCSIVLGVTPEMEPGSLHGLIVVVDDIEAARADLVERQIEVSEVDDQPWGRFVYFSDPDGNSWMVQQLPMSA
ncbi:MAG: VOC family protein [Acidimicrobiales bacterium]